jgi:predicted MFS family arabinose efflux permease
MASKLSQRIASKKLILISLFVTSFATQTASIIVNLLMIEIGQEFNLQVGVIGQLVTAASIVAVFFALITGVLTMRYSTRTLLLIGILFYILAAIGCFLAPNFPMLLLTFSLSGLASAITYPMLGTVIGEVIPSSDRSRALGVITAGQPIAFMVGSPSVAYIATQWGWRQGFLLFMLPVIVVSFIVVFLGVPTTPRRAMGATPSSVAGFMGVLMNSSARSCLIGALVFQASMYTSFTFAISFLRQIYDVSPSFASILMSVMTIGSASGSLTVSYLVKKLGEKKTAVYSSIIMGFLVFVLYASGLYWVSIIVILPWAYFGAAGFVSGDTLTLDQVPEYRGTLMSLNVVARNIGMTIGALLGGGILLVYSYQVFGLVMGVFGFSAAVIYRLLTKEVHQQ